MAREGVDSLPMDQILLGLGAAGAALLIIAITVALWEHRRHIAEMRQQLAWSDNTRDLMQAHAKDVDARLATLSAAVNRQSAAAPVPAPVPAVQRSAGSAGGLGAGQPDAVPAPAEAARVSSALPPAPLPQAVAQPAPRLTAHAGSAAVAMAAAQSAVTQQWIDTEPMVLKSQVPDFDPTMPAELSEY